MWLEHERIGELRKYVGVDSFGGARTHIGCNAVGKWVDVWGEFDLEWRVRSRDKVVEWE